MSEKKLTTKEIADYFRSNIFESVLAYNAWKMINGSRSKGIVSTAMAKRYTQIQKYHPEIFASMENAFLFEFVIKVLHSFDGRKDSASLYKLDREKTEKFVLENQKTIEVLKKVRHELFAHRSIEANNDSSKKYRIPSMKDLDLFFENLTEFYNLLTRAIDSSSTLFDNAYGIKNNIESLFMNIRRGETVRKEENDITWTWNASNEKASDIL